MDSSLYSALAELCDSHLESRQPQPVRPLPSQLPFASCAVYVACDSAGRVCRVGSVCRPNDRDGLATHVKEYIASGVAASWHKVYVLPLKAITPEKEVRRMAGNIAGWLLPYDNERWPRPFD